MTRAQCSHPIVTRGLVLTYGGSLIRWGECHRPTGDRTINRRLCRYTLTRGILSVDAVTVAVAGKPRTDSSNIRADVYDLPSAPMAQPCCRRCHCWRSWRGWTLDTAPTAAPTIPGNRVILRRWRRRHGQLSHPQVLRERVRHVDGGRRRRRKGKRRRSSSSTKKESAAVKSFVVSSAVFVGPVVASISPSVASVS